MIGTQALVQSGAFATTETVGDVTRLREGTWEYRSEMSDKRVSGTLTLVVNADQRSDGSSTIWGTSTVRGDDGTWEGTWTGGIMREGAEGFLHEVLRGTGAYEGLTLDRSGWFSPADADGMLGTPVAVSGWIEEADGSPVEGTSRAAWQGRIPVVGPATFVREWVWEMEMSDPRVSGTLSQDPVPNFELRDDASVDFSAEFVITSDEGTWVCDDATGTREGPDGARHYAHCLAEGTGAYAGLVYDSQWFFIEPLEPGDVHIATGWIGPAS